MRQIESAELIAIAASHGAVFFFDGPVAEASQTGIIKIKKNAKHTLVCTTDDLGIIKEGSIKDILSIIEQRTCISIITVAAAKEYIDVIRSIVQNGTDPASSKPRLSVFKIDNRVLGCAARIALKLKNMPIAQSIQLFLHLSAEASRNHETACYFETMRLLQKNNLPEKILEELRTVPPGPNAVLDNLVKNFERDN